MAALKLVINDPKTGKSYQKTLEDETLVGKKLGDVITGDFVGLDGYQFSIRGASDFAGFPLRKDVEGPVRKKVLMGHGVGNRTGGNNLKFRKTVSGNAITPRTVQVNLMVTQYGTKALDDVLGKKEDAQPGQ